MNDYNTASLNAFMRDQDRAAERGERMTAWRKQRESELEVGMDPDALANTMEADPAEWHMELATICTTPDNDRKVLKLDEVRRRLVKMTLDREESRWTDS